MRKNRRTPEQIDSDLYSTHILEQLQDNSEWQSIDDILKLAFKAATDIVQTHAQSLKDLKAVLTTRASKTQLNAGLSMKCNITDVTKTIDQLSRALQEKVSYQEVASMLREFATKTDMIEIMAQQSEKDQIKQKQQQKQNIEVEILKARMDDFQKEISKRVGGCVSITQFHEVLNILQNKVIHELLKANINEVNEALEGKVSKQYLTTALQKKVSKSEMEGAISKKADTADLDYLVNSLQNKVSVSILQKLTQVVDNKADKSDLVQLCNQRNNHNRSQQRILQDQWHERVEQMRSSFTLQLKELKKDLLLDLRQNETSLNILRKDIQSEMKKYSSNNELQITKKMAKVRLQIGEELDGIRQLTKNIQQQLNSRTKLISSLVNDVSIKKRGQENIYSEIDDVRKKLEEYVCKVVQKKEFIDFKSEVMEMLENKVQTEEVQIALDKFQNQVNSKMANEKLDYVQIIKNVKDALSDSIAVNTTQIIQMRRTVSKKQDRNDNVSLEDGFKKIRKEVQDCRKTVDIAYSQIHSKINIKQYETDLIQIRKRFEIIAKEVSLKANIKDVCVLSDSKPNIDDVNNALKEINQALAQRVTEADLQNILKDQATINETLCSQNIIGRWMWQTGQLKPGGLIPWQSQSANTVPDHFFWQKDKTSILIIAAGVYQVTACIFNKNNSISILVNGEQINMKSTEQNINIMNKRVKKRKEKQLGSISVNQYVMLPPRSRLSICCLGESSEGLLNIRRL